MQQKTIIAQTISLIGIVLVVALAGCIQKTLTVSEVWENAQELDGRQIRVRGWAYVYTEPYVGFIGCPPAGVIENDVVVGRMYLLLHEQNLCHLIQMDLSSPPLKFMVASLQEQEGFMICSITR